MRKIIIGLAIMSILTGLALSQAVNLGQNSMVVRSGSGSIQYELQTPLPTINDTAIIYKAKNPVNMEYVKDISNKLDITNCYPEEANPGTIGMIDNDRHLLVYNNSGAIWYAIPTRMHPVVESQLNLPDEETAKKIASDFLVNKGFLPDDAKLEDVMTDKQITAEKGSNKILQSFNTTIQVRYGREINGLPVVGPGNKLKVFIGDNGEVVGLFKVWRDVEPYTESAIKTPEKAYSDFVKGIDTLPARISGDKFIINDIALGYWMEPADQKQMYIMPVYTFKGDIIDSKLGYLGQHIGYVYAIEDGKLS